MKKLVATLIALAGLIVAGLLLLRQSRRAPAAPTLAQPAAPVSPTARMDSFQSGVKLDTRTGTVPDSAAKRRLLERLQREEKKQRPTEGRN